MMIEIHGVQVDVEYCDVCGILTRDFFIKSEEEPDAVVCENC